MFTGLAEETGRISGLEQKGDGLVLEIKAKEVLRGSNPGDSIAVDGVCLTVVRIDGLRFAVDAVSETLTRTTLAEKRIGCIVNLERAMAANGRFGGHFVQGHVDGTGRIVSIEKRAAGYWLTIDIPENLCDFVIEKGSIAIDGLSLTIAHLENTLISVAIIPHTWAVTSLQEKKTGDKVNIEVDLVAKYINKMLQPHKKANDLTFDKLADFGYE